jgi:uncharacterized protein DUF4412
MARTATLALVLCCFAGAPAAAADNLMLKQRTSTTGGSPVQSGTRVQTQYFSGSRMVTDDTHLRSIVDLEHKTLTLVDKDRKTYGTHTFDELREQMEEARKHLDELPPEARKLLALDPSAVHVTPTGRTDDIAGYSAKEYAVDGGPAKGTVWIADALPVPAEARDWERLSANLGGPGNPGGALAAALARLDGVPLRTSMTVALGSETIGMTTEVVEVRRATPDPGLLEVPAGFRKE